MKTYGIITVSHNRPKVLELWCASIKRLRYDLDCYIPAVCISDKADKIICDKYNIVHFTQENQPVSEKFNRAFRYAWTMDWDYVIILGSDDIMSTQLLRNLATEMEKGTSLIGINGIYFYCGDGRYRGRMVRLESGSMLGVAKTISKGILDNCGWRPFPEHKNWGIDAVGSKTIAPHVTTKSIVYGDCFDVKTQVNLNKWTCFGLRKPLIDPNVFYNILSEEEKQLLLML
jgi:hypothetical protein